MDPHLQSKRTNYCNLSYKHTPPHSQIKMQQQSHSMGHACGMILHKYIPECSHKSLNAEKGFPLPFSPALLMIAGSLTNTSEKVSRHQAWFSAQLPFSFPFYFSSHVSLVIIECSDPNRVVILTKARARWSWQRGTPLRPGLSGQQSSLSHEGL